MICRARCYEFDGDVCGSDGARLAPAAYPARADADSPTETCVDATDQTNRKCLAAKNDSGLLKLRLQLYAVCRCAPVFRRAFNCRRSSADRCRPSAVRRTARARGWRAGDERASTPHRHSPDLPGECWRCSCGRHRSFAGPAAR